MGTTTTKKDHKPRLGRGLSSLLSEPVPVSPTGKKPPSASLPAPESSATPVADAHHEAERSTGASSDHVQHIELDRLRPNPFQPRRDFDVTALAELAMSIKSAGVMQPILARTVAGKSDDYEIIAGERRWRAARDAGLAQVPVLIRTLTDQETAEWSLVENVQREDLNAVDRSMALRRLASDFGLSHGAIADRVGLNRSSVTNLIRLGELEKVILDLLCDGTLSAGHGKALLAMAPGAARVALAKRAAKQTLSVRRVEQLASGGSGGKRKQASTPAKTPAVIDMERQLREHLGTEVSIETRDGKRGTIAIAFYDIDHFDRLRKILGVAGRL